MSSSTAPERVVTETIRFAAGPYMLEGELLYPESSQPVGAVVVANPHPLLGGDMGNNVVRELTSGLAERGLAALRFNYRGTGGSEGPAVDSAANLSRFWETSHIASEADYDADLEAAIDYLREILPAGIPVSAAGYSFGCSLLPRLKSVAELHHFVLIAPTVAKHNYDDFLSVDRPTLVIAPEDDFATEIQAVKRWFDRLTCPKKLIATRLDNHFFRGHEHWLTEMIFAFLSAGWEEAAYADWC
jgi:uncharacterized protein